MKARRGVTYLEYALLAALVGIVGAVGLKFYGGKIYELFKALGEKTAEVTPQPKSS
jgi:Flp pilus assembly pilin Flp